MSGMYKQEDKTQERAVDAMDDADAMDVELEQALKNFRLSMHAWSDAAWSRPRPRTAAEAIRHRSWRLAVGWALGCVLVAGSVSGGLFERQHQIELRQRAAQQRAAEQQKQLQEQLQEQQASAPVTDEALLDGVDSDVSRQVPSAMEPLAQMMSGDETK
jgi:hypothetical protein